MVSSICTRTITVKAPGVTRFLDVKDCRSILKEMEAKFKVYINIKCVAWEPLPHQVMEQSQLCHVWWISETQFSLNRYKFSPVLVVQIHFNSF